METDYQLSSGLDYYKLTMSQLERDKFPDVQATFAFKNRSDQPLARYVDRPRLQQRLDDIQDGNWSAAELAYIAGRGIFDSGYVDYLRDNRLPAVTVGTDPASGEVSIQPEGPAPLVSFWETIVMSQVNEAYFDGYIKAHDISRKALHQEGDRRLSDKIDYFRSNPGIKFADFGTRRRFSEHWHGHVVERLAVECSDNFVGTSNVALAAQLDLAPIGTFAHELPMMYAAVADTRGQDVRASHGRMIDDWCDRYPDLSILLTDTFGSRFFFDSITRRQAKIARGLRHDSGDPLAFGEETIAMYECCGINPNDKSVTFSDGLNIAKVDRIHRAFKGRLGHVFGIGTDLTNDLGLKAPNNVAKVTHVHLADGRQADAVKLSDESGKHSGPAAAVARYEAIFS